VFAIGPKVRGVKPGQGDGFLRAMKIRSTPSFVGEVQPEAPSRKILRHVKIMYKYEQKYFARLYENLAFRPLLLPAINDSAGRNASEL
jgi:hypothetical protein